MLHRGADPAYPCVFLWLRC